MRHPSSVLALYLPFLFLLSVFPCVLAVLLFLRTGLGKSWRKERRVSVPVAADWALVEARSFFIFISCSIFTFYLFLDVPWCFLLF